MNGRQRVEAVLSGTVPDTVPIAMHNFLFAARYIGVDLAEGMQKGELLAKAQLAAWRDFGHDCLLMENGVAAMAEALGCQIAYDPDTPPHVSRPVLEDMTRIDTLNVPDPESTYPLTENLKCTRIVVEEVGDRAFVMGRADQGPMALAAAICGPEQMLMALVDEVQRPLIERIIAFCTECNIAYGQAQKRAGAHGTSIGGYGTAMLSPDLYRRLEQPRERQWCQAMRDAGISSFVHICDNTSLIIDDMVQTGASALELDSATPVDAVRRATDAGTAVLGIVDVKRLLPFGTPDEVHEGTRQVIEQLAPGGKLILSPGCAVPVETPPENVHAMVEAARQYGRYAPDGSLI